MTKAKAWKQVLGASALTILFGATAAQAQSTQNPATTSKGSQAGSSGATGSESATGAVQSSSTGQAVSASLSKADQRLLGEMAQANLAEIEAGRIAQEKTQNEQVKNFAQQMIDDHTKALQEVQQLAQAKGVTLPNEPDRQHKKMGQKLSALSGAAFDRRYMAQSGQGDHRKTHNLLQRVQARATDPEVKALAAKLQPTVDQHMNRVQQLNAALESGAGKGTAGTSSGTSGTSGSSGASGTQGSQGSGGSGSQGSGTPNDAKRGY